MCGRGWNLGKKKQPHSLPSHFSFPGKPYPKPKGSSFFWGTDGALLAPASPSLSSLLQLSSRDRAGPGLRMPITVLNVSQLSLQHLLMMFPIGPSPPISFGPF